MNIVLIGFMGTGKTVVAKELARQLRMEYVDMDETIETREQLSIPEIFAHRGEDYFRNVETEVAKELSGLSNAVISTGGGVVLRKSNLHTLRSSGYLVCLEASPEIIFGRIKKYDGERPLLSGFSDTKKRIRELLAKRRPFYSQADFIIDTSALSVKRIVEEIIDSLSEEKLKVNLRERSYPIFIGSSIDKAGKIARNFSLGKKVLIISDTKVFPLYGARVKDSFEKCGFTVYSFQVPRGEKSKSIAQARRIYKFCLNIPLDRSSSIVALGGGVVGDLAGFVAATFIRGVNFLMIPTTLLAQVDSSVGGKVAVNLPQGKNLVGCFYQPKFVLVDLFVLRTLSTRRIREGMAEVIKCAMISDSSFFAYLEKTIVQALQGERGVLRNLIKKALEVKIQVVEQDEREEKGIRQILNFGHTIAHAVEASAKYGMYTHGEAVAVGMVAAGKIGVKMGLFAARSFAKLEALLKTAKLPTKASGLNMQEMYASLKVDKKTREGKLLFVLPREIGKVELREDVPSALISEVIQELII